MCSIIDAKVVDFPDPVGPVTRKIPFGVVQIFLITSQRDKSSSEGIWDGI